MADLDLNIKSLKFKTLQKVDNNLINLIEQKSRISKIYLNSHLGLPQQWLPASLFHIFRSGGGLLFTFCFFFWGEIPKIGHFGKYEWKTNSPTKYSFNYLISFYSGRQKVVVISAFRCWMKILDFIWPNNWILWTSIFSPRSPLSFPVNRPSKILGINPKNEIWTNEIGFPGLFWGFLYPTLQLFSLLICNIKRLVNIFLICEIY